MSEVRLDSEQIKQLKQTIQNEIANKLNFDKLELIGYDKVALAKMRSDSDKIIEDANKLLSVFGNG